MKKKLDKFFKTWKPETECIVVGSSPSLTWYDFGKHIDKFKNVVRVNLCFIDGLEKHTGKKLDIWATTNTNRPGWGDFSPIDEDVKEVWVRTPVTRNQLNDIGAFKNNKKLYDKVQYISPKGRKISMVHNQIIKTASGGIGTGMLAINKAINEFEKITIIGHTFYLENKDINIHLGQEKEDENHKYSRKSLHDGNKWPLTNLSIIKDLIKQDKIILLNPFEYDNLEGEDS